MNGSTSMESALGAHGCNITPSSLDTPHSASRRKPKIYNTSLQGPFSVSLWWLERRGGASWWELLPVFWRGLQLLHGALSPHCQCIEQPKIFLVQFVILAGPGTWEDPAASHLLVGR